MDNESIMRKDKLGAAGILRESLGIAGKNPKLLVFTVLTSFPLFLFLLLFEFRLQEALFDSARTFRGDDSPEAAHCDGDFCFITIRNSWDRFGSITRMASNHFQQFAMLGLMYLFLVHPLDLLNTISILCHSSALYSGKTLQSFREFLHRPIKGFGFKGPLITSLYALLLSAIITVGLISLGMQIYQVNPKAAHFISVFEQDEYYFFVGRYEIVAFLSYSLLFGGLFLALLMKYIEWSSVWNVGIVISVMEEKHGDIAIGVAGYLSRGSRKNGFLLMLVFFLWRLCLRSLCLYLVAGKKWGVVGATAAQVLGVCLGNLIKWVVFLVYYCDCKKGFLEKKFDVEDGRSAANI